MDIINEIISVIRKCSIKELLNYYYKERDYINKNANNPVVGTKVVNACFILMCIEDEIEKRCEG